MLTRHQVQNVLGLPNGNHKEADTLIFARAVFAVKEQNAKHIAIEANDMDIIVMAIYHYGHLPGLLELWVQKHTVSAVVYLPCHIISQYLETTYPDSSDITGTLLAAYIITGCDTLSYPFRIGKKQALNVTLKCLERLEPLASYMHVQGDLEIEATVMDSAQKYFFALYENKGFKGTIHELRCHLFLNWKGDIHSLPATEDVFRFHVLRVLHQLTICKCALEVRPLLPDPTKFGRKIENGALLAVRMSKDPKPKHVARASCKCRKGHCRIRLPCRAAGVKCMIACCCLGNPEHCDLATSQT